MTSGTALIPQLGSLMERRRPANAIFGSYVCRTHASSGLMVQNTHMWCPRRWPLACLGLGPWGDTRPPHRVQFLTAHRVCDYARSPKLLGAVRAHSWP
jgi:hypothetical protein